MRATRLGAIIFGGVCALIGIGLLLAMIPIYYSSDGALDAVWSTTTGRAGSARTITVGYAMALLGIFGVLSLIVGAAGAVKFWREAETRK